MREKGDNNVRSRDVRQFVCATEKEEKRRNGKRGEQKGRAVAVGGAKEEKEKANRMSCTQSR